MERSIVFRPVEEWMDDDNGDAGFTEIEELDPFSWFQPIHPDVDKNALDHLNQEVDREILHTPSFDHILGPTLDDPHQTADIPQEFEDIRRKLDHTASRADLRRQLENQRLETRKWRVFTAGLGLLSFHETTILGAITIL